ncbi:MAG: HAD family phosphatase [Clostridiales bacterium]|nr:HAD family phosphatase [Clostridiales bacterium]
MAIQGAIFDFDGTLVDSMHVWKEVLSDWLGLLELEPVSDLYEQLSNMSFRGSASFLREFYSLPLTPDEIILQWEELARGEYQRVAVKDGVLPFLTLLKERRIPCVIATACMRPLCEACMQAQGLDGFFLDVLYADELKTDKTQPDIYLKAAQRMGIPPKHCVVFEDLPTCAPVVHRAGMTLVGIFDVNAQTDWEVFRTQADYAVTSLMELTEPPFSLLG